MILTYIDETGTSHDLPKLTKSLNAIIKDVDVNVAKGLEDNAYKSMLELVKKCLGDDIVSELFGSTKYDDNLALTELNVACVEIARTYRKPVEDAKFDNSNIEQMTKLFDSIGNVDKFQKVINK